MLLFLFFMRFCLSHTVLLMQYWNHIVMAGDELQQNYLHRQRTKGGGKSRCYMYLYHVVEQKVIIWAGELQGPRGQISSEPPRNQW